MVTLAYFQLFIISVYHLTCLRALTMEGVSLAGQKQYILLQNTKDRYVLECKYSLKEGETTTRVVWYHDDFLAFEWGPPDQPKVGVGLKEGDVVLTRTDGNLEFSALRDDLAGNYRCEVTTSASETYKSFDFQLLVVDMPPGHDKGSYAVDGCKIRFSYDAPPIAPKPDIVCGVWSEAHGYILTAAKWMATPYFNGSVAYSLDNETFDIFQMPLESLIRCEIKITKVDDSQILLLAGDYKSIEIWERGCTPLEVGDGVELEYDNERVTCHAEVRPKDEFAPVIAHVKCKEGYMAKYADFVSSVDMVCEDTKWDIGGGLSWNHFDNLLCVENEVVPERPPTKKEMPSQKSENMQEGTSAGSGLITPWMLILLVGGALLSGLIWSVKGQSKAKDPRHMA